ncbi:hypothetical protein BS78_08G132300 [Paspalum vaginatum]|nr:hypothetical protein BS78_08G132300 [Paspalum vaginatum]
MIKQQQQSSTGQLRLPPGPWRLPVIGSLHHLLGKPLFHRAMADLANRLDAPLMYLKLGEVPVMVATSPQAAREVMCTHEVTFASRPWSPTIKTIMTTYGQGLVLPPYGNAWLRLRRASNLGLLSARRVQSFRHIREDEVGRLVTGIAAVPPGVPVNLSKRIAVLIADSTVRAIIGDRLTVERREVFLETLEEKIKLDSGLSFGDLFPSSRMVNFICGTTRRALANHRKNLELVDCAIKQHQKLRDAATLAGKGGAIKEEEEDDDDDFLDLLFRMQKDGGHDEPLTTGTIKALILTSATTLQWAMSEVMRNPKVMKRAQDELRHSLDGQTKVTEDDLAKLKYVKLIIKETLRLHPPGPLLLPRECGQLCKIVGYDVPKGTVMIINAWAISRDPKYWDDPEEFIPERFERGPIDFNKLRGDFDYIPFGAGRRMCPGILFAQVNIELALASLLFHFDWKLQPGLTPCELDMAEEMGITIRRKNDLQLHAIVRVPFESSTH